MTTKGELTTADLIAYMNKVYRLIEVGPKPDYMYVGVETLTKAAKQAGMPEEELMKLGKLKPGESLSYAGSTFTMMEDEG